jgi:hypothetical protein
LERWSVSETQVEDVAGHALAPDLVLHGLPHGQLVVDVLAITDDDR